MITINRIKNIAKDIIADDEWVNDSHSASEHKGVIMGLELLVRHLEEISRHPEENRKGGDMEQLYNIRVKPTLKQWSAFGGNNHYEKL